MALALGATKDETLEKMWDEKGGVVSPGGGGALVAGGAGVGGAMVAGQGSGHGSGGDAEEEEVRGEEKGFDGEEAEWVKPDLLPTDICEELAGVGFEGLCRTGRRMGTPSQIQVGGARVWIPTFAALG